MKSRQAPDELFIPASNRTVYYDNDFGTVMNPKKMKLNRYYYVTDNNGDQLVVRMYKEGMIAIGKRDTGDDY